MSSVRVNNLWTRKQITIITSDYSSLFFDRILCSKPKWCVHSAFLVPGCLAGRTDILKEIISLLFPTLSPSLHSPFSISLRPHIRKILSNDCVINTALGKPGSSSIVRVCLFLLFPTLTVFIKFKLLRTTTCSNCINILESCCTLVSIISRSVHLETYVTLKINEAIWPVIDEFWRPPQRWLQDTMKLAFPLV